jgi:hypothetical protein
VTPVRLLLAIAFLCAGASATTYYVDPVGSNANDGLSPQTPWRTLLKVGISTFQPGDSILFKRDGVWNEWLTPPSSGAAGNLIKFDSYGNGRPPSLRDDMRHPLGSGRTHPAVSGRSHSAQRRQFHS